MSYMASSFVIYVDEAGDEGFKFRPNCCGSSEWFVLTAVVTRKNSEAALLHCLRLIKARLGRDPKFPLHFRELKHTSRVACVQEIAKIPIRTASILIHKPSLTKPESFTCKPYQLYRYASRMLIERCSWFCRDHVKPGVGDGKAELIFSNRSGMSYQDMWDYWTRLKDDASQSTKIIWDNLDLSKLSAINHDQRSGLQIADCVASAHWQAVSLDKVGVSEPRYFQQIESLFYRHRECALNYGVKFFPPLETIRPSQPHLSVFDGLK
jgi:hypothetical protein